MNNSTKNVARALIGTLIGGFGLGALGTPIAVWFAPDGGTRHTLVVVWVIQACSVLVMAAINRRIMKEKGP